MRAVTVLTASLLICTCLPCQELVVNYLGGTRPQTGGIGDLVTEPAALGVSPDGRLLYVSQASLGYVLRYDLPAGKVDRIVVRGLTDRPGVSGTLQSITGIGVNADGTAILPIGSQIARIELNGTVTNPGAPFAPQNATTNPVGSLRATVRRGTTSTISIAVFGEQQSVPTFWWINSANTAYVGNLGRCTSSACDNTSLPPGGPSGRFESIFPWGLAMDPSGGLNAYFTDPGRQPFVSKSIVATVRSGNLTILGHPGLAAIPMGSSGQRLSSATGIVLESSLNLLVADTGNHRILRRTPAGVWSVFAGTGVRGALGDGGAAIDAQLFEPKSLAMDAAGTLYIHDSGNGLIRRILPDGIIERVNIDRAQTETHIRDLQLPFVSAIATDDAGQIYVASGSRILRVDSRGNAVFLAGTGATARSGDNVQALVSPIGNPGGLVVDSSGGVMFSERDFWRLRRVDTAGSMTTVAGTGRQPDDSRSGDPSPALSTSMSPGTLSLDADDSVLFADGNTLRRLRNGQVSTVTGLGWCGGYGDGLPAIFTCARGLGAHVTFDDGQIAFLAEEGASLHLIDAEGFVSTWARFPGFRSASVARGPNGSAYVLGNAQILRVSRDGQIAKLTSDQHPRVWSPVSPGQKSTELPLYNDSPITTDSRGFLYFWDSTARRIIVAGEPSSVEIDTQPSGISVRVDGQPVTTPRTYNWLPGDYHTVEAEASSSNCTFSEWTHGQGTAVTWMPSGGRSRVVANYCSPPAAPPAR